MFMQDEHSALQTVNSSPAFSQWDMIVILKEETDVRD